MTTYAVAAYYVRSARFVVKADGLMTAVAARNVATTAVYALLAIYAGQNVCGAVELIGADKLAECFAAHFLKTVVALTLHPLLTA